MALNRGEVEDFCKRLLERDMYSVESIEITVLCGESPKCPCKRILINSAHYLPKSFVIKREIRTYL